MNYDKCIDTFAADKATKLKANFVSNKRFGPEKCPVDLKIPWIGDVPLKYENQIKKAINFCSHTVNPRVVYNTRVFFHLFKKIVFLPIKKVWLFMNFPADVKLGMWDALHKDLKTV